MTTIRTVKEVISERLKELRTSAQAKFENGIRPIYGSTAQGRPVHVGSCLFLNIKDVPLLVTAAHVIDNRKYATLYVGGKKGLVELEDSFYSTEMPHRDRKDDHYDFAISKLTLKIVNALGDIKYICEKEISTQPAESTGHAYLALGYPNSQNKKINHQNRSIRPVIWPYTATIYNDPSLAIELGVSGDDHLFIKFDRKWSQDTSGKRVRSISPTGISGGALIDLGNVAKADNLNKPSKGAGLLVGVLIENPDNHKAIVITRIGTIIRTLLSKKLI